MKASVVVGIAGVPVAMLLGRWFTQHVGTRGIERRLLDLYEQVLAWQAAHDHQVETIDRRLREVEESAARAANEARIVSTQLDDLNCSLSDRLREIEHRMARGGLMTTTTTSSGACAVGSSGLRARQVLDTGAEW